jgi:N utilization substance protein B
MEFTQHDDGYLDYATAEAHANKVHLDKLLALYKFLINHDSFVDLVEDQFPLWIDDKSLVVGAMKKTIKSLPATDDFLDQYEPDDDTVKDFGEALLSKVIEADEELLNLIEPTLKNWDADRVAILDMILIKMALSEMLHFPTIPTKVTLNEFVELAKQYSTDKSKDFINGILDRLLKQLTDEGLINKQGRGLVDD